MAIYVDDRELVAAHQAGDGKAFDELVREYRSSLYRHARRKLLCDAAAEDAVQEALVRAYRALPNFDGEYRLGPWLHRIVSNVCVDEVNRRRRDGEKTSMLSTELSDRPTAPSVEEELGLQVDNANLESALSDLADPYREALLLRFVDELEYEQVAAISGVSEPNARARVSRGRAAMKSIMKGLAFGPVFLFGLLKRGEKAAAAATSASTPVTAVAGTAATGTAASAASQVTSAVTASLPVVAEATVAVSHAAPAAVPVIAKAAVGIGLAAAVLTPTSDSSIHQAVETFASGTAGVVIVEAEQSDSEDLIIASSGPQGSVLSVDAAQPVAGPSSALEQLPERALTIAELNDDPVFSQGLVTSDKISWTKAGAGRFYPSGNLSFVLDGEVLGGKIVGASAVRIDLIAVTEGKARFDGVFEVDLVDGRTATLSLLGFATGDAVDMELEGYFRLESSDALAGEAGSFAGSLNLSAISGAVNLSLTP